MDISECMNKGFVKKIKPDRNLEVALTKSSDKTIKSQALMPLNNITTGSKISLMYDALRELLEAISVSKGYKIYNHECYKFFY